MCLCVGVLNGAQVQVRNRNQINVEQDRVDQQIRVSHGVFDLIKAGPIAIWLFKRP